LVTRGLMAGVNIGLNHISYKPLGGGIRHPRWFATGLGLPAAFSRAVQVEQHYSTFSSTTPTLVLSL
jgi:hypothetical protein